MHVRGSNLTRVSSPGHEVIELDEILLRTIILRNCVHLRASAWKNMLVFTT